MIRIGIHECSPSVLGARGWMARPVTRALSVGLSLFLLQAAARCQSLQEVAVAITVAEAPTLERELGVEGLTRLKQALPRILEGELVFWQFQCQNPVPANWKEPLVTVEFSEWPKDGTTDNKTLDCRLTLTWPGTTSETLYQCDMNVAKNGAYGELVMLPSKDACDEVLKELQRQFVQKKASCSDSFRRVPVARKAFLAISPNEIVVPLDFERFHAYQYSTFEVTVWRPNGPFKRYLFEVANWHDTGSGRKFMTLGHFDPPPLTPPVAHQEIWLKEPGVLSSGMAAVVP